MLDKRIIAQEKNHASADEALIARISERARNLFLSRQLQCAEAVLVALNRGLRGGLSEAQAVALAAPFGEALGESGCLCGALSGAVMAAGLFLGNNHPFPRRRQLRSSARQLHDAFKTANGSTCCRVLSRKFKDDKRAHLQHCADLTVDTTEMAARLILQKRPELAAMADNTFIANRESAIRDAMFRLLRLFHI